MVHDCLCKVTGTLALKYLIADATQVISMYTGCRIAARVYDLPKYRAASLVGTCILAGCSTNVIYIHTPQKKPVARVAN